MFVKKKRKKDATPDPNIVCLLFTVVQPRLNPVTFSLMLLECRVAVDDLE